MLPLSVEQGDQLIWDGEVPPTQGRWHHGFQRSNLVRGIRAEIDLCGLHIRVTQPERDFAQIPRGLQDH
ncbi:MAG: hypothetical protein ACRDHF_19880, partial [Tepidiformaceae bacterium]